MRAVSEHDLRCRLAATLDRVTQDGEPVVITRESGKPAAVLLSLEEFASWEETLHLCRSPANARRLHESIAEFDVRD